MKLRISERLRISEFCEIGFYENDGESLGYYTIAFLRHLIHLRNNYKN